MDLIVNFHSSSLFITLVFIFSCIPQVSGASFTFINKCSHTVWPGILGNTRLDSTGFELSPASSRSFQAQPSWSGRFWGRTACAFDPNTGQGNCLTGDCGSNQIECNGAGANPPATLAEFTLGSGSTQDFYDVSLVDGYNLAMLVDARGGSSGSCMSTGCVTDLNQRCPAELRVAQGDACKSACEAFGNPEYCCSGAYASPAACKPSVYSKIFKSACPRSYSYAFDDATSTFTCSGADYTITFCPSLPSQKSTSTSQTTTTTTTNASNINPAGVVPMGVGGPSSSSSWFSDFLTGDSSRTISCFSFHSTLMIASLILFVLISFI